MYQLSILLDAAEKMIPRPVSMRHTSKFWELFFSVSFSWAIRTSSPSHHRVEVTAMKSGRAIFWIFCSILKNYHLFKQSFGEIIPDVIFNSAERLWKGTIFMEIFQYLSAKCDNFFLHSSVIGNNVSSLISWKYPYILITFCWFFFDILRNNFLHASKCYSLPYFFEINFPFIILILLAERLYFLIDFIRLKQHWCYLLINHDVELFLSSYFKHIEEMTKFPLLFS